MNAIVATDSNLAIGYNNELLFKIPSDMKFFKDMTESNVVVMGTNTFKSTGKPLPNRANVVISRNPNKYDNINVFSYTYEDFIDNEDKLKRIGDIFIIGGEQIYKLFINDIDTIYHTQLNTTFDNVDAYFVNIFDQFEVEKIILTGLYNGVNYNTYKLIKK